MLEYGWQFSDHLLIAFILLEISLHLFEVGYHGGLVHHSLDDAEVVSPDSFSLSLIVEVAIEVALAGLCFSVLLRPAFGVHQFFEQAMVFMV